MTGQFTRFERDDATYEFRSIDDSYNKYIELVIRPSVNDMTVKEPLVLSESEVRELRDHLNRITNYDNERDATTRRIKELSK